MPVDISGATEILDKLPVHLDTTTRCYPNYVVYSDYEEHCNGQLVIDALKYVSKSVREEHSDFELYRRLIKHGRPALRGEDFSSSDGIEIKKTGNAKNPGWKLDKWKFLPMLNRTINKYPNMNWYVFAEGDLLQTSHDTSHDHVADILNLVDTYIVWASMLQYLSALDPTQPLYRGMYMWSGSDIFAYGGAGFILSRPAMQAVAAHYSQHQKEFEDFVDDHWAGDHALGKAVTDAGVPFKNAWPVMQGDYPGWLMFDSAEGRSMADAIARVWCTPVATFHHTSPDAIRDMWTVEQEWNTEQDDVSHLSCLIQKKKNGDLML